MTMQMCRHTHKPTQDVLVIFLQKTSIYTDTFCVTPLLIQWVSERPSKPVVILYTYLNIQLQQIKEVVV